MRKIVHIIKSLYNKSKGEITIAFDNSKEEDKKLVQIFKQLMSLQPRCGNCVHQYYEPSLGSYQAFCCKIHGVLEAFDNLHHDCDGSKCESYKRKKSDIND